MPELPEVETIRRDLAKLLVGKTIIRVSGSAVGRKKTVRIGWGKFKTLLSGTCIDGIGRRGKLLVFDLDNRHYLLIHLKMTGQLVFLAKNRIIPGGHGFPEVLEDNLPSKYTHVVFHLSDGPRLFFNDMRQFGYMDIVTVCQLDSVLKRFGVDAISPEFTLKRFGALLHGRRTAIKSFLLNQKLIAGIGNIYADEICFEAKVQPDRPVNTLNTRHIRALHAACREILTEAIECRGTTFSNYRDGEGRHGNYSCRLQVYGREDSSCLRCKKGRIDRALVAGRGTRYCPKCQK